MFAALNGKKLREVIFFITVFYYFFNGTSPFWLGSTTVVKCSHHFREVAGSISGQNPTKIVLFKSPLVICLLIINY